MNRWINLALDVILIALVTAGLVQATRLIRQLSGLQQGRIEMERFVREFNATVMRAEGWHQRLCGKRRAIAATISKNWSRRPFWCATNCISSSKAPIRSQDV